MPKWFFGTSCAWVSGENTDFSQRTMTYEPNWTVNGQNRQLKSWPSIEKMRVNTGFKVKQTEDHKSS